MIRGRDLRPFQAIDFCNSATKDEHCEFRPLCGMRKHRTCNGNIQRFLATFGGPSDIILVELKRASAL